MPDKVTIAPVRKFSRTIVCPPDKSITHRAVLFGGIAQAKTTVYNPLLGDDCLSSVDCMRRLGAQIDVREDKLEITGATPRSAALYTGNSGTTMRLLAGLLAGRRGEWTLAGDASVSARPMGRVIDPLTQMGAVISSSANRAPLCVRGRDLHGIAYTMPVDSAQVKSAILLAGLTAEGETTVTERIPSRDHTERMLAAMGVPVRRAGKSVTVERTERLQPLCLTVAGDISSAAFPLAAGLMTGGNVRVRGVGLNPTRTGLLTVFDRIGAAYEVERTGESGGEPIGDVTVYGLGKARPFRIEREDIPSLVDEIPVLCVLASALDGVSEICGAEELRVKESNRIEATVRLLRAFGGKAEETESGLRVYPSALRGDTVYDPRGDHRMAMSAAVAAAASEKGGTVTDASCVAVSYPNFWKLWEEGV